MQWCASFDAGTESRGACLCAEAFLCMCYLVLFFLRGISPCKRSLTRALSFISCIVLVLVQGGDALMLVLMLQEMFAKKMFAKLVN